MKKLYFLSLMLLATITSFGQPIYSENFGTPTGNTSIATYSTGTAPATFQNATPIVYTGTSDVRVSTPSTTYSGASGGGNIFFTTTAPARVFQIDGINTSAYLTANIRMTFGLNVSPITSLPTLEFSTNASSGSPTWTSAAFSAPTATGWSLVTVAGGILPSSTTLSLRFTQPAVQTQMRIDDIKVFNFNPACTLVLGLPTTACDAVTSGIDTYTATIPYTGGGTAGYVITPSAGGTVGGDSPNTVAAGNITISGVNEGTANTINIVNGTCSYSVAVVAASCKTINALPYYDGFAYTAATNLTSSQMWSTLNSGDEVLVQANSLVYAGTPAVTTTGNSIAFVGSGAEAFTPFTATTSGTLYTQFLMNVTDVSTVTDLSSDYFAALTDGTGGGYKARLFTKRSGTQYQLGLDSNSTTTNFDTTLRNVGDVLRIVVAYDFAGNTLNMWVNPADSGSAPTLGLTPAAAIPTLGGLTWRQNAANTTPAFALDELRVTTNLADLGLTSLATNQFNEIAGFSMYPNPVSNGKLYISSDNSIEKTIAIYDIIGKQIINQVVTNEVNVASLTAGIYIVKVTEEGKTATRKLIVR